MTKKPNKVPRILISLGTRPEIIRFSSLIRHLKTLKDVDARVLYTGQHFSENMSSVFFDELELPLPEYDLNIGELAPVDQITKVFDGSSKILSYFKPNVSLVWGDTNSSVAFGFCVNKLKLKLAHVEAGCRSGDFRMAEEYNRIILDQLSDYLFPVSANDAHNLAKEKIHGEIYEMGDPLFDIFLANYKKTPSAKTPSTGHPFGILTLHRAENVDDPDTLRRILTSICTIKTYKIFFAVHPRTRKIITDHNLLESLDTSNIIFSDPVSYHDLLGLMKKAAFIFTDSGGVQKEAFFAKIPCVTFRHSTEWLDTVRLGANLLIEPKANIDMLKILGWIPKAQKKIDSLSEKPYGDGKSTRKIADKILELASK